MSAGDHHAEKSSETWLWFWFVCFVLTVAGIGFVAIFTYNVDAPEAAPSGGGHGMILPIDGEYAPHARVWPTV